jgi:multidrug efflux pump subunit AcrB
MTCVTIAIVVVGWACYKSMSVDLFPDVSVPVVTVQTTYRGAGPAEIETLVSRPIEDEVSTISGIKRMTSKNMEGVSQVIVEFVSSVDSKYAEQQVRDKVNIAKPKLPDEVDDPVIKKFDPSDTPILMLSLVAKTNMSDAALYDIADQTVKPRLEQVNNVGAIEILGGRKREIHVLLDRKKLKNREISVSQAAAQVVHLFQTWLNSLIRNIVQCRIGHVRFCNQGQHQDRSIRRVELFDNWIVNFIRQLRLSDIHFIADLLFSVFRIHRRNELNDNLRHAFHVFRSHTFNTRNGTYFVLNRTAHKSLNLCRTGTTISRLYCHNWN